MIFDSDQQKNFILDCVRKYPTNYETALNLANAFGQAIQDGRIIDVKEQVAKFPIPIGKVPAEINDKPEAKTTDPSKPIGQKLEGSGNGNGDEQTARVQNEGQQQPKAEGGPATP